MSEQLSIPAGGGLLSLNLSVLPQGLPAGGSGQGAAGIAGFGSLLGQQGQQGQQGQSGENSGGFFLPQSGGSLPLVGSESLSQSEMMQQQLAHLAQMLEQQKSSPEGELPAQLATELAKALRRYSEEGDVLPAQLSDVEGGAVPEGDLAVTTVVDTTGPAADTDVELELPLVESVVANVNDQGQVVEDPQGEGDKAILKDVSLVSPVESEVSIAPLSEDGADSLSIAVPSQHPDKDLPPGVEVSSARRAEPAGEHPLLARQAEVAGQPIPALTPQAQTSSAGEQSPVPVLPISSLDKQQKSQGGAAPLSMGGIDVARERGVAGTENRQSDTLLQTELSKQSSESLVDKNIIKGDEKGILNRQREIPIVGAGTEQPIKTVENSVKPLGDVPFGQKLETTLEATQQLLQKVSSVERGGASPSLSRTDDAAVGLTSSSSQNLMQPTQVQKTLSEGHTLMMPNQTRMNTPAWNNALGERAVWIAAQNTRVAEIKLDPPELGSLNVRINISQDQVNLSFTSPHAHVRDAVEQSLPRLREMFAEQGLQLQDSSVSDQSSDERRERFAEAEGDGAGYSNGVVEEGAENTNEAVKQSLSLVDYYA